MNDAALRALHLLPPEAAHGLALRAVASGLAPAIPLPERPRLRTTLFGRGLPHPLGLAAGFDKNAQAFAGLLRLGFAFVEVGTVTPRPQAGNPRPRLFRLREDQALINRMGFNNDGLDALAGRLAARDPGLGMVGANLGVNKDAPDAVADYVAGLTRLKGLVDYLVVNVSSPNTPGLRDLQAAPRLARLLDALLEARGAGAVMPLLVKIAPDLDAASEEAIAQIALDKGIDGLVVSNTTIARPQGLRSRQRNEKGGLSGPPLLRQSTELLRRMARLTGKKIPLIGVGGITSSADAYAKIRAGACALQLYTAFVYQGPAVVGRVLAGLDQALARDRLATLADAVGLDAG